jgi:pyruvate dehydrogenase E1 component alpha subunit
MYSAMLKCRMLEEWAGDNNVTVPYDLATGHEAIAVGATIDLKAEDAIAAFTRNFAVRVAMETSPKYLLKGCGATDSNESPMSVLSCGPGSGHFAVFPADPFNLATGVALSHKLEKKTNVVVAFWDEDGAPLDASHEALKFAGIHKLPILYVTRSTAPHDLGSRKYGALDEFSFIAKDYGFPSILVDGNDVVAIWRAAQESVYRARSGSGPTLVECQREPARFGDPLEHMQHYMTKRGAWDEDWKRQVLNQVETEITGAMRLD